MSAVLPVASDEVFDCSFAISAELCSVAPFLDCLSFSGVYLVTGCGRFPKIQQNIKLYLEKKNRTIGERKISLQHSSTEFRGYFLPTETYITIGAPRKTGS